MGLFRQAAAAEPRPQQGVRRWWWRRRRRRFGRRAWRDLTPFQRGLAVHIYLARPHGGLS
jgi:hypothetical protein